MLVSLQQEDRRKYKKEGKGDSIPIGFEIFKVCGHLPSWFRVCSAALCHLEFSLIQTLFELKERKSFFPAAKEL